MVAQQQPMMVAQQPVVSDTVSIASLSAVQPVMVAQQQPMMVTQQQPMMVAQQ